MCRNILRALSNCQFSYFFESFSKLSEEIKSLNRFCGTLPDSLLIFSSHNLHIVEKRILNRSAHILTLIVVSDFPLCYFNESFPQLNTDFWRSSPILWYTFSDFIKLEL